jgi:hypothetical protein
MMAESSLPRYLKEKVEEWKRKAKNERDPFNKYFTLYVAYNIIYGYFEKPRNYDKDKADKVIEKIKNPENLVISIRSQLAEYLDLTPIFREEYWYRKDEGKRENGIHYLMKKAYQDENHKETLKQLNRWLYKVRCNLFHGEKSVVPEQEKIVSLSSKLVESIIDEILKNVSDETGS